MQKCPKCGKAVENNSTFCPACGACLDKEQRQQNGTGAPGTYGDKGSSNEKKKTSKGRKKRSTAPAILLGILLIAAVAAVMLAVNAGKKKKSAELDAYVASSQNENGALVSITDGAAVTGGESGAVSDMEATQSPSGENSDKGAVLIPEQTPTTLSFKVMQYGPRDARITLGNLLETCAAFNTTSPKFTYSIQFHFPESYTLTGGFQCLTGANEETPVKLTGETKLIREGKAIPGVVSAVAGDDGVTLVLNIADWTGFYFDQVEYYDVTLSSLADPALTIQHIYTPEDVKTINYLDAGLPNGHIQIDVPGENQLTIRLTDDMLQDGYLNSPVKGNRTPLWELKICEASYKWISITLDGTHGEPIDQMTVSGKQMFSEKREGAKAASFEGIEYSILDNTMVISVSLPKDLQQSIYRMRWLEASLSGGTETRKIRLMELDS